MTIPLVVTSDLKPDVKALTALIGATPLLTKLIAIGLLGRPMINVLRGRSSKAVHRESGDAD